MPIRTVLIGLAALLISAVGAAAQGGPGKPNTPAPKPEKEIRPNDVRLEHHCRRMFELQTSVFQASKELFSLIQQTGDKKPRTEHRAAALKLSATVEAIIEESLKATRLVEDVGIAFTEVFDALRKDLQAVHGRLRNGVVDRVTLALQQDSLETPGEMIDVLKPGRFRS